MWKERRFTYVAHITAGLKVQGTKLEGIILYSSLIILFNLCIYFFKLKVRMKIIMEIQSEAALLVAHWKM